MVAISPGSEMAVASVRPRDMKKYGGVWSLICRSNRFSPHSLGNLRRSSSGHRIPIIHKSIVYCLERMNERRDPHHCRLKMNTCDSIGKESGSAPCSFGAIHARRWSGGPSTETVYFSTSALLRFSALATCKKREPNSSVLNGGRRRARPPGRLKCLRTRGIRDQPHFRFALREQLLGRPALVPPDNGKSAVMRLKEGCCCYCCFLGCGLASARAFGTGIQPLSESTLGVCPMHHKHPTVRSRQRARSRTKQRETAAR